MIRSVKELQVYLLKEADGFQELMMTSPGCSEADIEKLKEAFPGISESYTQWVKAVNLNGISVGYFEVSPGSCNSKGMVANLIEYNNEQTREEYAKVRDVYFVATRDGFEVYVSARGGPFQEGEIILISNEIWYTKADPEKWIYRLANCEEF